MKRTTFTLAVSIAVFGLVAIARAQDGTPQPAPPAATAPVPPVTPATPAPPPAGTAQALPPVTLPPPGTKLNSTDADFLKTAGSAGVDEVAAGKLAQDKAQSDTVKQLAQEIVSDHSTVNDQIRQLASAYDVKVADSPDKSGKHEIDKLSKLNGPDFDTEFVKDQAKGHQDAIDLFQKESAVGQDPTLKQFASNVVPVLQQHLKMVTDIQSGTATDSPAPAMPDPPVPASATPAPPAPAAPVPAPGGGAGGPYTPGPAQPVAPALPVTPAQPVPAPTPVGPQ